MTNPHPNATVGLTAGSGGGALLAWLLDGALGWNVPPVACAAIAGGVAGLALLIGRSGIVGIARHLWYGDTPPPSKK